MKKIHTPDNVAHLFAHQSQQEATNPGRTLFFDNDSIYSYGRHFCIAKHVINQAGKQALLFTTRSYSNTTAKHINIVGNATNHLNKIYCSDPSASHTTNIDKFISEIKTALKGLQNARKPEKYINEAERIQNRAEKYAQFFNLSLPAEISELLNSAKDGKYKEYLIAEAERIQKEREETERKEFLRYKKEVQKFRKHEVNRIYNRLEDRDFLRLNSNNRLQTSQGVEIPSEIAKRAYNWIKDVKTCDNSCNYQILEFSVKELTPEYIRIGCHTIDIKEINKIAKKLNW